MSQPIAAVLLSIFCLVSAARPALAEAPPADARDAPSSLPGVVRVGLPAPNRVGVAVAGTAGYGMTESVLAQSDKHNRVFGSIAASLRPNAWFSAALRIDGRYDWHSDVPDGNGGGAVGEPRLLLRATTGANDLRVGVEGGVRFPGEKAPSVSFTAVSPEISLLAAYVPASAPIAFGSQLGFRYDRSAETVSSPDRLSRADRMSLGVSDTNAALLGVGLVAKAAKEVELLAEWSWDVRVPAKGVGAAQSPMRVDVGGRYLATDTLALQLVAEVTPTGRPPVGPGTPLAVIEPRFSVFAGIALRPALPAVEAPAPPPPTPSAKPAEVQAGVGRVDGRVTDDGGRQIAGAKVHVGKPDSGVDTKTNDFGTFELAGVPVGKTDVTVTAEGYRENVRTIDVAAGPQTLEIQLERALPQGQIRGLARSFAGQPIKGATVRIDPIGKELVVGEGGRFEVDVPPGEYDVIVKATGYADQHRHVRVEANGVVVLDLDMRTRR
jgi:hypothetical protein